MPLKSNNQSKKDCGVLKIVPKGIPTGFFFLKSPLF
jgi:hypothetical protein